MTTRDIDSDADHHKCSVCLVGRIILIEQREHLQTYRCACGAESYATVYPGNMIFEPPQRNTELFAVWLEDEPNVVELGALRTIFPAFEQQSLRDLRAALSKREHHVGQVTEAEALALQERAKQHGLRLVSRRASRNGAA